MRYNNFNKRPISLIIGFFFVINMWLCGQSEIKEKPTIKERLFFGGNFSLQIGTITFIEASPIAGYRITPRLASGLGASYMYYSDKRLRDFDFKTHIYGGRVFTQYSVIRNLQNIIPVGLNAGVLAYAEFEALSLERFDLATMAKSRYLLESVYVGGGFELPVGYRSRMNLLVLWNISNSGLSPYSNPSVRIGFVF